MIIAGAAVLITILTVNAVAKPSYDLTVAVICTEQHHLDTEKLRETLMQYVSDRDGDGKVTVLVKDVSLAQGRSMPETERSAAVQDQSIYLYLVDQAAISQFEELFYNARQRGSDENITDQFVNLEEKYPGDQNTEGIQFHLMGSKLQKGLGINEMDAIVTDFGNLSLVIRTKEHAGNRENWVSCYEESMRVLERIILE